ncbi:hypothetical protein AAMO2058_000032800 [Amorphochlora amoebiformis]|mmetsp:Transcript_25388/g.40075  ORF Transcript_25388/g.40075 Transcript_25388/m.40075 type:complete len:242 (-) Transcript_25388:546-1271(-)|eukprot:1388578-Amorphochlora_amoeboformis.AAC.1
MPPIPPLDPKQGLVVRDLKGSKPRWLLLKVPQLTPKKKVSFGDYEIRSFKAQEQVNSSKRCEQGASMAGSTARSVLASRKREKVSPKTAQFELPVIDWRKLSTTVNDIMVEKWANPIKFFNKGESVHFQSSRVDSKGKTWAFTWDFIDHLSSGNLPPFMAKDAVIIKRGYTVAEVLRRSSRNLDHSEYTNSLVQLIYSRLAPASRLKTDAEWIQYRLQRRNRSLKKPLKLSKMLSESLHRS